MILICADGASETRVAVGSSVVELVCKDVNGKGVECDLEGDVTVPFRLSR